MIRNLDKYIKTDIIDFVRITKTGNNEKTKNT